MTLSYVERFKGLFNGNVASTSTSTGTIVVTGGIGVSGAANTGSIGTGAISASGAVTMTAGTASTSTGTGTLVVTGGVGVSGAVNSGSLNTGAVAASGAVTMTQNTASTSTGTGTLVVTGGVGVSGTIYSTQANAGNIQVSGNTISSTNSNGDIVFSPNGTGLVKIGTNEVATKSYVDASIQGLDVKQSVKVATVSAGTLATSFAAGQTVDGYTLVAGDRILIKDQSTASENGIYTVNASGAPTRAIDADQNAEVTPGLFTFVEQGSTWADTGWVLATDSPITVGTTGLTFVQFSSAGVITAGNGITKTGNVISANLKSNGGIVIQSGALALDLGASSITGTLAVSNGGTGATTLTGYVYGNGTGAMTASTTIPGSAITGAIDNVTIGATTKASGAFTTLTANGAVTLTAGTASTSTGTGTLVVTGGVGVSGAVTSGSVSTGAVAASGAVTMTAGNASTSTSTGTLVVTGGIGVSGAIYSASQVLTGGTASTSTGTGTLVVTGGVGVSGAVNSGSVSTGAVAASGAVTMTAGTASTSTGTGTLVVTGGVGVSGQLTTQNLSVSDQFNMGVTLSTNSWATGEMVVRSGIVDFKTQADYNLFTVPTGYMFLISTMEIVTTSVSGAAAAPSVQFGYNSNGSTSGSVSTSPNKSDYYGPTQVTSNSVGARHIIENPQDGSVAGTVISFGITTASTATAQSGCAIVRGFLFKTS